MIEIFFTISFNIYRYFIILLCSVRLNVERVNRPGKLYATEQTLTLTPEEVAFSVTSPTQNGPVNLGAHVMELGSADRGKRYTVIEYNMLQLAANLYT